MKFKVDAEGFKKIFSNTITEEFPAIEILFPSSGLIAKIVIPPFVLFSIIKLPIISGCYLKIVLLLTSIRLLCI